MTLEQALEIFQRDIGPLSTEEAFLCGFHLGKLTGIREMETVTKKYADAVRLQITREDQNP